MVLLAYKVSPEPTRTRVGIWRRIKSLGAVYLQSSVCIPACTSDHERQLKLLQNEIVQAGGIADVLETTALDKQQEVAIVRRFQQDREAQYREIPRQVQRLSRRPQTRDSDSQFQFCRTARERRRFKEA